MKKQYVFIAVICIITAGMPLSIAAQEYNLEGEWTAYAPTRLPAYTMEEHRNPTEPDSLALGTVTFGGDGELQTDFMPHTEWQINDRFLVLSNGDQQDFYGIRQLTPEVIVLVNLTVTEQNRRIINIRVHRPDSLLLIQQ
ncbi:MAG: hypothetical protein ACOCVC_06075 [Spirochaeta sp.]